MVALIKAKVGCATRVRGTWNGNCPFSIFQIYTYKVSYVKGPEVSKNEYPKDPRLYMTYLKTFFEESITE